MEISETVLKAYFSAVFYSSFYFDSRALSDFKSAYPNEYKTLNAFYRLRSKLRRDLALMKEVGEVQWLTLTFDNKHDRSNIATKRKNAMRFLNSMFVVYEMVEEFGHDNGRYHVHGFGVFKDGYGFKDFRTWPCRQKIEILTDSKMKKKIKYLTNYALKDLPRLRRSKSLVWFDRFESKFKSLKTSFKHCYSCRFNIALIKLLHYNVLRDNTTSIT